MRSEKAHQYDQSGLSCLQLATSGGDHDLNGYCDINFGPATLTIEATLEAVVARRTIEVLTSDLSGEEMKPGQGETIEFSVQGTAFVIDLTDKEAKAFHKAVEPYIQSGTKAGRISTMRRRSGRSSGSQDDLQAIREWARANGYEVADRGRISMEIKEAYRKAH